MADFNAARLVLARQRRRLTQTQLAELIGLTRRALVKIERQGVEPESDTCDRLAEYLKFPRAFFFLDDPPDVSSESASFRALTSTAARDRDCARACGALAAELHGWIVAHFSIPAPDIPSLSLVGAEDASRELREHWQLGERPIRNVTHLLELKGARVFSLSGLSGAVDAFSFWHDGTPFVMVNTLKSAEHARFDLAHELGHLVLHRQGKPQGIEAEREAHSFASALLMPKSEVVASAPQNATLGTLIRLKARWGVALIALVHRLAALNLLSEWHARQLYIEIAQKEYRRREPAPLPQENSQLLSKVLGFVRASGNGLRRISADLCIPTAEIDSLAFGLATVGVSSGGSLAWTPKERPHRPRLSMVPKHREKS